MTSSGVTRCGGPSSKRLSLSMPAGYVSHTGYQYDSISLVAGHREPAPPSNLSKLGGFRNSVFIPACITPPQRLQDEPPYSCATWIKCTRFALFAQEPFWFELIAGLSPAARSLAAAKAALALSQNPHPGTPS